MKNYIYLFFDTVSELPSGVVSSPFEPDKFVELTNRQCMQQPLPNMDTTLIYLVCDFDSDLGVVPPFQPVGDLMVAYGKLKEYRHGNTKA